MAKSKGKKRSTFITEQRNGVRPGYRGNIQAGGNNKKGGVAKQNLRRKTG